MTSTQTPFTNDDAVLAFQAIADNTTISHAEAQAQIQSITSQIDLDVPVGQTVILYSGGLTGGSGSARAHTGESETNK